MTIKYDTKESKKVTVTKDIKVPYYAFLSDKRDSAVKITADDFYNSVLKTESNKANYSRFNVTMVANPFATQRSIKQRKYSPDYPEFERFIALYDDYHIEITKEEYDKFEAETFETIKNEGKR